jgi:hypothetical protein
MFALRRPILAIAVAALIAGAFAFGGRTSARPEKQSSGAQASVVASGNARALALVSFDGTIYRKKGFTAITNAGGGIWCLKLPSTIKASTVVPVVSVEFSHSPTYDASAQWASNGASCVGNQLQVFTFAGTPSPSSFANEAFTIVVP